MVGPLPRQKVSKMNKNVNQKWNKYYVNNHEILALIKIWRNSSAKDKTAVEQNIIRRLSYLVCTRIRHYKDQPYYEDLLQEGKTGLVESIRRFDPNRGINFFKFGGWYIQNKVNRYLKSRRKYSKFEILSGEINYVRAERHINPDVWYEKEEGKRVLKSALNSLPEIDRQIVSMRFGIDGNGSRTYQQIGDVFSISRQYAEQVTSRAIASLRKNNQVKIFFCEL